MAKQPPPPAQERPTAIATVALKILPFRLTDPAVWFAHVKAQFSNQEWCSNGPAMRNFIAALAPDVATEVRDLILHPPAEQPYDRLKETLIRGQRPPSTNASSNYSRLKSLGTGSSPSCCAVCSNFWATQAQRLTALLFASCSSNISQPRSAWS